MPRSRNFCIVAVGTDGLETTLSVRINAARSDWEHETSITLPNGKYLSIISRGVYQVMGSNSLYRSTDPAAP